MPRSIAAGDAEAWRELARWATGKTLATQAGQAWSQVVAVLPDDDEANRALGRVRVDGRWVTEAESYRARGFVEFEGEWMTPAERQSIQDERRARERGGPPGERPQVQARARPTPSSCAGRGGPPGVPARGPAAVRRSGQLGLGRRAGVLARRSTGAARASTTLPSGGRR